MATVINGSLIAKGLSIQLKARIQQLRSQYQCERFPGLAVIIVGNRKDSETYVRMKERSAKEMQINFSLFKYPESVTQDQLLTDIGSLNDDSSIDGIIVQLPLPAHINKREVLSYVSIEKDVDGFHALNIGNLALEDYTPLFMPCTPRGVMHLLKHHNVELSGKHCVVLGKSNIVGLPLSLMLLKENATVTICNSETQREEKIVRMADVLISAVGKAGLVRGDWIKPGAVVIDVGINPIPDSTKRSGYRLVGDVDFDAVNEHASLITPVPNGVGPLTISMLLLATVESFERRVSRSQ